MVILLDGFEYVNRDRDWENEWVHINSQFQKAVPQDYPPVPDSNRRCSIERPLHKSSGICFLRDNYDNHPAVSANNTEMVHAKFPKKKGQLIISISLALLPNLFLA